MPAAQLEQMKKMGMDVDIMKQSLQMLKDNPEAAKGMAEMMDTMSPEELMERSKQAQERLATTTTSTSSTPAVVDAEIEDEETRVGRYSWEISRPADCDVKSYL